MRHSAASGKRQSLAVREQLHALGGFRTYLLLQADEISRQEELDDLSTALAQGAIPEGPAFEQGEELVGLLALAEEVGTGLVARLRPS